MHGGGGGDGGGGDGVDTKKKYKIHTTVISFIIVVPFLQYLLRAVPKIHKPTDDV